MTTSPPPFTRRPPSGDPASGDDGSCARCGADEAATGEYHMLVDDVWAEAARGGERRLCLGCVEARLGRLLTPGDFTDAPVNRWPAMSKGDRRRSHLLGLPGFVLADADVPRSWSARFLDRLGLGPRYAYWIDHPDGASPVEPI